MRSGGSRRARACTAANEQFVDTPTREKGPFLWDAANESEGIMRAYGDQNMSWQALRDVARGQARYWPGGQVNAVYPNGDGARTFATSRRATPSGSGATTPRRATRSRPGPATRRRRKVVAWLWSARQAGTGLLYGLADTSNGDPVYGYDLSVAADTASNVLAVNAFNRVAQLAALASDAAGAADNGRRGRPSWPRRSTPCCAGATACTSTGSTPTAPRAATPRRRPTHCRSPTAWCRRPTSPRWERTSPSLGIDVGPNHGLELLRGLAAAGMQEAMVHTLTDTSIPGLGPHRGGRRDLHLGGLEAERPHRRLHVARVGLLCAGRDAGVPSRGHPAGRPMPTAPSALSSAPPSAGLDRGRGLGADDGRTRAGVVAAAGQGHDARLTVPTNATATVRLPAGSPSSVRRRPSPWPRRPA